MEFANVKEAGEEMIVRLDMLSMVTLTKKEILFVILDGEDLIVTIYYAKIIATITESVKTEDVCVKQISSKEKHVI
jgi:hypothetical protein